MNFKEENIKLALFETALVHLNRSSDAIKIIVSLREKIPCSLSRDTL